MAKYTDFGNKVHFEFPVEKIGAFLAIADIELTGDGERSYLGVWESSGTGCNCYVEGWMGEDQNYLAKLTSIEQRVK